MKVSIFDRAGDFAEDKDVAAAIRESCIRPTVAAKKRIVLNFDGVALVTQSFVHALISDILRSSGEESLKHMVFKGCNSGVKGIVETVVQCSLETLDGAPDRAASGGGAPKKIDRLTKRSSRRGPAARAADRSR